MKKRIVILGSTGSIGKQTIQILKRDKRNFQVDLLLANSNIKLLSKQIKEFKVKNIIVRDYKSYLILKKKFKNLNISNNINDVGKLIKGKADYTMSAVSGFEGLSPTLQIIKKTKSIAIANKESIICGWNLIKKELKKNNTKFIPVDSEHFSIWSVIDKIDKNRVKKIILTASGGPFLNKKIKKKISPLDAIKHPNWKMGKKISIDSATLINKVFEIIEAKKIFDLHISKFSILIHPKSYIHSIVEFKNGLIKIVAHDTNMRIPIFNSIYFNENKEIKTNKIDLKILNQLNFQKVNIKRFPIIKLINKLPKDDSLFETVLVSINDELVNLFLKKEISFSDISKKIYELQNLKEFTKFKYQKPKNLAQIERLNDFVRLKTRSLSVISNPK